jgi:hypothetical protein
MTLAPAAPHDHDWRLQAVLLEDGCSAEEYGCSICDAVDFR